MPRNRLIQTLAIVIMLLGIAGAGLMVSSIDAQRSQLQLAGLGLETTSELPPAEMFSAVGLGVFRGIWVDVLWYQINADKEAGRFFDINQKARLITSLQPRFPQVWSFQAWNMAYNVSVMTHTPQERWDWVSKGIALLRDKGIPYNPRAIRLYRELGWIFFHKVGQFSDDMQWYYKQQLAREWHEILGAPTDGATKEQAVASFSKIANAPDRLDGPDGLLAKSPETGPLIDRLKQLGYSLDTPLLQRIGRLMIITYSSDAAMIGLNVANIPDPQARALAQALSDPQLSPGVQPLLAYLRNRTLIDHYHMDPKFMLELMNLFGPLDWRHPASHAAYWASMGTKMAATLREVREVDKKGQPDLEHIDLVNTYRGSIHAMQELMYRGRMSFDPITGTLDLLPDPRFIDAYETAMYKADDEILKSGLYSPGTPQNFRAGHENFLLAAIVFSYLYGDRQQAENYYERIRKTYGTPPEAPPDRIIKYRQPLDDLVFGELSSNWDLSAYSGDFIDAMLQNAFSQGLANGRRDVFDRFMAIAKAGYDRYSNKMGDVSPAAGVQGRRSFLPWDKMVVERYISYVKMPSLNPLIRFHVWNDTPDALRLPTYDRLKNLARAAATQAGLDPDRAFPEPVGMADYRKAHPEVAPKVEDESPAHTERK